MSGFSIDDIPHKAPQASEMTRTQRIRLPIHLRPLLIMVDGRRSVRDLLALGIRGVSIESFDELHSLGLIDEPSGRYLKQVDVMVDPAKERRSGRRGELGLSEARFGVIDLLLDLSTQNFAARPWIEKMERVETLDELRLKVRDLCGSELASGNSALQEALVRIVT